MKQSIYQIATNDKFKVQITHFETSEKLTQVLNIVSFYHHLITIQISNIWKRTNAIIELLIEYKICGDARYSLIKKLIEHLEFQMFVSQFSLHCWLWVLFPISLILSLSNFF